jgi:hypothetical protein
MAGPISWDWHFNGVKNNNLFQFQITHAMIKLKGINIIIVAVLLLASCKKDVDPIIVVPTSSGSDVQLNGLVATEAGSSAGNTVFIDFSEDKQTSIERKSWDLGFYCGNDFRVILNNTTAATAKATAKTDMALVGSADTVGLNKLAIGFDAAAFLLVDNVLGDLSKTVINAISPTDADNKVYIINRGVGGGIAARDWYKVRILRNATAGYKLQYAKLTATTFTAIDIAKDDEFNFKYISFDGGAVAAEPAKVLWDIKWSYNLYQTTFGTDVIPFTFSDFIHINKFGGVQAAEIITTAPNAVSYDNFTKANVASLTFSSALDVIGGNWRSTQPATGARLDRFYVVKDPLGNFYKVKFLAMGLNDGGTRGKPQLRYKLLN